jgi:hypothetical protein
MWSSLKLSSSQVAESSRGRVSQSISELTNAYKSPAEASARVLIGNDKRTKYDDNNWMSIASQRARRLSILAFFQD